MLNIDLSKESPITAFITLIHEKSINIHSAKTEKIVEDFLSYTTPHDAVKLTSEEKK
jgi:hypothetical protein